MAKKKPSEKIQKIIDSLEDVKTELEDSEQKE